MTFTVAVTIAGPDNNQLHITQALPSSSSNSSTVDIELPTVLPDWLWKTDQRDTLPHTFVKTITNAQTGHPISIWSTTVSHPLVRLRFQPSTCIETLKQMLTPSMILAYTHQQRSLPAFQSLLSSNNTNRTLPSTYIRPSSAASGQNFCSVNLSGTLSPSMMY
jgi:hypothetical protein